MNKKKLGTILTTIGTICIIAGFLLFTCGGFTLVSSKGSPFLIIIGFVSFFIGGVLLAIGGSLRAGSEIANITNGNSLSDIYNRLTNFQSKVDSNSKRKCHYCGNIYDKSQSECPSCGASDNGEQ